MKKQYMENIRLQISTPPKNNKRTNFGDGYHGVCDRYCIKKCSGYLRYSLGFKRCSKCEKFFDVPGIRCPCCNQQLRCKRRDKKNLEATRI